MKSEVQSNNFKYSFQIYLSIKYFLKALQFFLKSYVCELYKTESHQENSKIPEQLSPKYGFKS